MRKTITTFAFAALVAACGGGADEQPPVQAPPPPSASPAPVDTTPPPAPSADQTPPPAPKPAMSDMQTAMLKTYPTVFTDAAKVAALYANDAQLNVAGMPAMSGREAIQQYHQQFLDVSSNLKLTPTRAWMKGNQVACEWVLTGTQTKDWSGPGGMTIPASDKPWGFTGGTVFTLNDDGLISKEDRYFDMGTYAAQVMGKKGARAVPTPSGNLEVHVAKGDATEDKDAAAAKQLNDAFDKHDAKAFLGMLDDAITYDDVTAPAPMNGKKSAEGILKAFAKAFPKDQQTKVSNLFGVEDFTIDELELTGTQTGPLSFGPGSPTIPPTKKAIDMHQLEILQWKDGKAVKGWAFANGMEMMGQLGVMPKGEKPKAEKAAAKPDKGAAPKSDKGAAAPKDVSKAPKK